MKVHFNNVNFSSSTGPNSFATRLAQELTTNFDVKIVNENQDYDVFLCFIEPTFKPKKPCKFIQRLDGIWFKPEQFNTHNELIKWAYTNCNKVIWQSQFDKTMTTKWWGDRPGTIIRNGIKIEKQIQWSQISSIREKYEKIWICAASWHRQKRLKENITFFQNNSGENDVLMVLGNNPDYKTDDKRVLYLGNQPHEVCLQLYSISDWMIHLAWLDHCPNVVVEALSQNCPIICTDSGGTKEIVKKNGIIIPEIIPYDFSLCDYDNPPPLNLKNTDLKKIDVKNDYLDINSVAKLYINQFKN